METNKGMPGMEKIISGSFLSPVDEDGSMGSFYVVTGRKSLASAVGEIIKEMREEKALKYQGVFHRYFMMDAVANMDAVRLTKAKVKEFMNSGAGLQQNDAIYFAQLLRIGLNKLYKEGSLQFIPDDVWFRKFLTEKKVICYIDCPYDEEEVEKIITWGEGRVTDNKGLAVALLFTGGLAWTEIIALTTADCYGKSETRHGVSRPVVGLFSDGRKNRIVKNALISHPEILGYVFAVPRTDGKGWDALNEDGLNRKLSTVCAEIGIQYRPVYKNEVFRIK